MDQYPGTEEDIRYLNRKVLLFKTVSPIALAIWTVDGKTSLFLKTESYCISIRVILL